MPAKLPSNFNWKESAIHIQLLEAFSKPRDAKRVLDWQFIQQNMGEKTESAIDRFVREGALVSASLEESLEAILQIVHLKKMLQERDLRQSGSKSELVSRIIEMDRSGAEDIIKQHRVMKCSESALALLEERKNEKVRELEYAQKQSFELLKRGNVKEAYKAYSKYQKKFSYGFSANSYEVEELQFVASSCPSLLGNLTSEDKTWLQAAAGMKILWKEDKAEYWLPENFKTNVGDNHRAINYLIRNAYFRKIASGKDRYTKNGKVTFQEGDIESCDLCLSLNNKIFDLDEIPELPMVGCTSESGCMCDLNLYFSDDDDDNLVDDEEDEVQVSNDGIDNDPVKNLKILRQLLDEDLITQAEYDEKKKEILSRL